MIGEATLSPPFVLSPHARRALPLAVAAATLAHALVFALLLIVPPRDVPEPERVTYDLIFVEPEAPPAPLVAPEVAPPLEAVAPPPLAVPAPPRPKARPLARAPVAAPTPDNHPTEAGELADAVPSP